MTTFGKEMWGKKATFHNTLTMALVTMFSFPQFSQNCSKVMFSFLSNIRLFLLQFLDSLLDKWAMKALNRSPESFDQINPISTQGP